MLSNNNLNLKNLVPRRLYQNKNRFKLLKLLCRQATLSPDTKQIHILPKVLEEL